MTSPRASVAALDPQAVATALWQQGRLVLCAAPGAGKTTRIPQALQQSPLARPGTIWVIEPRRLAARMAARRVAELCHEKVGQSVGLWVRDERVVGPETKILFLTEGMAWRLLLQAKDIKTTFEKVSAVVLDEFHGRSIASDLLLSVLARWRQDDRAVSGAPAVLVMSATLDAAPIAKMLHDAPVMEVAGRLFPVTIHFQSHRHTEPLASQVFAALMQAQQEPLDNPDAKDILVFLPGLKEIQQCVDFLAQTAFVKSHLILPLHARLSTQEQDRAIAPSLQPRIILSTNVAETSLTLPQVGTVVDSALARQPVVEPSTGLVQLKVVPISQAAMQQRTGRAGRVTEGRCFRLLTAAEYRQRPAFESPDIERLPLDEMMLWLSQMGICRLDALDWVSSPPTQAVEQARRLLLRLGATDSHGRITTRGKCFVSMPLPPRLGAVVLEGSKQGVLKEACRAVIVLSDPPPQKKLASTVGQSDLWPFAASGGLDAVRRKEAERVYSQISRLLNVTGPGQKLQQSAETRLSQALLAGFCDRLARRQGPGGPRMGPLPLAVAQLGKAELSSSSIVRDSVLMLVLAARPKTSSAHLWEVTLASGIEPEWLVEFDPDGLLEEEQIVSAPKGRFERRTRLLYDGIVVFESSEPLSDASARQAHLLEQIKLAQPHQLIAPEALDSLSTRLSLVLEHNPLLEQDLAVIDGVEKPLGQRAVQHVLALVRQSLEAESLTGGVLHPLREEELVRAQGMWPSSVQTALTQWTPLRLRLGAKVSVDIVYSANHPPKCRGLIQQFFSLEQGPRILRGALPVIIELLGPHGRPLQTTQDLAGFWQRHYPELRPALARRYPRHAWPQDPQSAAPEIFAKRTKLSR